MHINWNCSYHPLDISIWSKVELSNFDFHINFTEPSTEEFKRVKKLIENEVSDLIFNKSPDSSRFRRPRRAAIHRRRFLFWVFSAQYMYFQLLKPLLSFKSHRISVLIDQNVAKAFLNDLLVYSKAIRFFIFSLRRYFYKVLTS